MSNVEPQNVEGWYRCALSFYKIDRIPSFDIRYSSVLRFYGSLFISFLRHSTFFCSAVRWFHTNMLYNRIAPLIGASQSSDSYSARVASNFVAI